MVWLANHQLPLWKLTRILGFGFLLWILLMLATPKIAHSPERHLFVDMRNFLGVPNTLNVITNFPFLVVGVLGFFLCIKGDIFNISLQGEVWGWALFYAGMAGVAFGSAHYHLKPGDGRVIWDTLPEGISKKPPFSTPLSKLKLKMMIAYSSLFSSFLVERLGERIGLNSLFALLSSAFLSSLYERTYNDLRLCIMFQWIPMITIPVITFFFRPKYTHSRYWLLVTGVYLLAKFEAHADRKIYRANHYIISGHSLGHLCLAVIPVLLSTMLIYRNTKCQRLGDLKERP